MGSSNANCRAHSHLLCLVSRHSLSCVAGLCSLLYGGNSAILVIAKDKKMKALRFETYGPPSVLGIQELPVPALQEGEVLVQIKASSINPSDVGNVAGRFHSKLPMTPGRDFAGVVVEGGTWKGKHVWGTGAGFGVVRP